MGRTAIKYDDLLEIAKRNIIGRTGYVKWESFVHEAEKSVVNYTGVGRPNNWSINVYGNDKYKNALRTVNELNRYCSTKKDLAKLLGVGYVTLNRWGGWLGEIKKEYVKSKNGRFYDAKEVLKRWGKYNGSKQKAKK